MRLEADRPEEADREPEPLPDRLEELELPFLAVELVGFFCAELAMVSSFPGNRRKKARIAIIIQNI